MISIVVIITCALFFLGFPLTIAPRFAALFREFGGELPFPTRMVLAPSSSRVALFFLAAGTGAGVLRERERTIILSLTAGGGITVVLAFVVAVYLPIFSLAGSIK